MDVVAAGNISQALGNGTGVQTDVSANNATKPKFDDVWKKIQAEYGEKPKAQKVFKKTLDKDDFMKIMISQMKNQDPTKPFEADKLASEIAQIASIEQLQNVNQALKKLETQNRPLERLAMTNLIGKWVTMDRARFPHEKSQNSTLTFTLPEDASSVKLSLTAPSGENIWEQDIGAQSKGVNSFVWNGLDSNKFPAEGGNYLLNVEAVSAEGRPLRSDTQGRARIIGVAYEGNDPILIVGDAKIQAKVSMDNVVLIEDENSISAAKALEVSKDAKAAEGFLPKNLDTKSSRMFMPPNLKTASAPGSAELGASQGVGGSPMRPGAYEGPTAKDTDSDDEALDAGSERAPGSIIPQTAAQAAQAVLDAQEKGFPNGLNQNDNELKGGE